MYQGDFWVAGGNRPLNANALVNEGDIHSPSLTPVFSDGYWVDVWPQEIDPPARNLLEGGPVALLLTRKNFSQTRRWPRFKLVAVLDAVREQHKVGGECMRVFADLMLLNM